MPTADPWQAHRLVAGTDRGTIGQYYELIGGMGWLLKSLIQTNR